MAGSRDKTAVSSAPLLGELLTLAQRRVTREMSEILDAESCTLTEWRVMRILGDGDGHLMGELAEALLIPHASLTRTVDSLARNSLVYRRQSGTDRRKVAVHLSREGRGRLDRLNALLEAHDATVLGSTEWTELASALSKVCAPKSDTATDGGL
ncbi:hypothetical protein GCM10027273_14730 [Nocardioides pakistanensis]